MISSFSSSVNPKISAVKSLRIAAVKSGIAARFDLSGGHGRTGRGGGGGASPPSLLGKQSQSGNIRSTVGQYWLIIKKSGTNYVNFVGNFVISGKVVGCFEKFLDP